MNPIVLIADVIVNALRAVRNLLAALLPAPEFVLLQGAGSLPERRAPPVGRLRRLLPGLPAVMPEDSLEEWRERLALLAASPRVRGIVLTVGDLRAGLAALESLRAALASFRASGKRVIAYLPTATLPVYYLASAAERIVAPDSAEFVLTGLRTEATFLRAALDRLGILPEFHHIAEYKTAANRYLHPQMPVPQREMVTWLLDGLTDEIVAAIAAGRGLSPDAVRRTIAAGLLSGRAAAAAGLVDAVAFEDDLPVLLGTADRPARILPWARARLRLPARYRWWALQRAVIGVVELRGTIVPGESRPLPVPLPMFRQALAGHETIARAFRAAEQHPLIKAIVFHVDSPGGSAVASDLIWRDVERVQKRKPVVVHMGNLAGSGGYYVACGARHIVAGAMTLTGSIGVVSGKFNLAGLFTRAGLRREVVARGATAAMFSAFTSFSEQEWAALRGWMDEIYARFVARVAAGRHRPVQEIEPLAGGRVWTGRQALARGLVDDVGDFPAAVRRAKALAGLPPEVEVPVVTVRPPRAAAVPAPPAAWAEALRAVARLAAEPALLLMDVELSAR